jgi:hypothetical protein
MKQEGQDMNQVPENIQALAQKLLDEKRRERLQAMIDGKSQPPNPYAAYIIQQIKTLYEQGGALANQLAAARSQVSALEQEIMRKAGAVDQLIHDLEKWDRPAEATSAVPTPPAAPQNGAHEPKAS